ncbi:MAG: aminotransferase class I/II-fold pyridoxal phosphate-dependent enzyme [Spirochaetaceae bacterium]|nr:MAG: aminotransferase class I/II-fold pyridoxal phosphate-dependent enzyme [Spirochaetaceae bacterium]
MPLDHNPTPAANFETVSIRSQAPRSQHREHSVPMFLTSSFVFDSAEHARALFAEEESGMVYSRYGNPSVDEFVHKLCALEGCEDGFATASGMAAMFGSMAALLSSGDHIVASRAVFGSTHAVLTRVLARWGIGHSYVDPADNNGWRAAITPATRMLFVETPSNPGLALVDLEYLGRLADEHGIILNVDNCFATPYLQTPARWGAHLVTHSATKFIDGQGRVLGGAILGSSELIGEVRSFARATGPALSPFNAWVLSKSLETLAVRMERHCENALALARHLEQHPQVNEVRYPFLDSHPQRELAGRQMRHGGGVVTFEVKGGLEGGKRFLDGLQMVTRSSNLGDTRSIATHPATTTHCKLSEQERQAVGITPGLVRVSVGLETIADIIADIDTALEQRQQR